MNENSFQLPNLINLSLKNNRIQVLGKTSLRYLKNLKSINLSGNPLYWVSPSAFWPNKALKQLYLNKTQLEYLTDEHLRPIDDFLDTLDLHEMPNLRMDPNIALSGVWKCLTTTTGNWYGPNSQSEIRIVLKPHLSDCQQLKNLDFSRSPSIRKQKIPFLRSLEYLNLDDIQLNSLGRFSYNCQQFSETCHKRADKIMWHDSCPKLGSLNLREEIHSFSL